MPLSASRRLLLTACLLPLAATAQTLAGPPGAVTLPDVVVTASRTPEALADTVGDVTVIGRDVLDQAPGDSLAQILGRTPGIQFMETGGPQTVTSLFMRGANTQHALILVDGIRVNGASTGAVQFPAIDPAAIERVEVLRGAASSLYGSDAIGGVINIITRASAGTTQPHAAWANIGAGSHGTFRSGFGLSGAGERWDYQFSASGRRSRGHDSQKPRLVDGSANPNWSPDRDGYAGHTFSGALGLRWAPGHRIAATAYNGYLRGDYDTANYDVFPAVAVDNPRARMRQEVYALTSTDTFAPGWESRLTLGFARDTMDDQAVERTLIRSINRQYSWINTFALNPQQSVSLLLERKEERLSGSTDYQADTRNTNAIGLIYKGRFQNLRTQASVRNDRYTGYGSQTTGSLGFDLDLSDEWAFGLAGSTAFHAPTFNELYWPLSFGFQGNPDLSPEKSRNVEAHLTYDNGYSGVTLTVYRNRVRNLIATVCDPFFNCTTDNVNRATLRGLSLRAHHTFGDTTWRASADFLDPRNDTPEPNVTGSTLPHRARQVFQISAEQRVRDWQFGAEYQYTGNRYGDVANQTRLGGYGLVNLTAAYDFSRSLGMQVRWNNVLDKDYVLVDGYQTPGSNVFVNLSWRM